MTSEIAPSASLPASEEEDSPRKVFGGGGGRAGVPNNKTAITHDAVIDILFAHPRITQTEIAQRIGFKSPVSVAIIMGSDAFQARYIKRQEKLVDPLVCASVEDRLRGIAHRSSEIVAERLESAPGDFKFALEAMKAATSATASAKGPSVNVGFVVHLPGPASSSDEWARKFAPEAEVLMPRLDDAPSEKP